MRVWGILLFWMLLAGVSVSAMPALAQQDPTPKEPGELNICVEGGGAGGGGGGGSCNCRERYSGDLLAVIVPCFREEVVRATERMVTEFGAALKAPIYAFLVLVMVIFGVKIVINDGDPKKDVLILLIKVGAVIAFTTAFGGMVDAPFGIQKDGVQLVTDALPINSEECEEYVSSVSSKGGGGGAPEKPWVYYDCVLAKLAGFAHDNFLGASALGLVGTAIWSGQFGTMFFMGAVAGLFFLVKLIIRGVYTYMMAVLVLGFLMVISPLLIPLIWMPATQQYFDRWLNAFMSVIIMPTIMIAYLMLAFNVLDKVAFDEETGIAKLLDKETVKEMWRGQEDNNSAMSAQNMGVRNVEDSTLEKDTVAHDRVPTQSGFGNSNPIKRLWYMDFRTKGNDREVDFASKLFFGFVALTLVTYILALMLDEIISMSQMMLGGAYFMKQAVEGNPIEGALGGVQNTVRESVGGALKSGNLSGAGNALISGFSKLPEKMVKGMQGS